jgi:hypothetical protein
MQRHPNFWVLGDPLWHGHHSDNPGILYLNRRWQKMTNISFQQPTRCISYSNLFCYKILHVSGFFSGHHQEFSTVYSALVSFVQVSDERFRAESRWNCSAVPSWLIRNLHETYQCPIYNIKLLMMGREDARNV